MNEKKKRKPRPTPTEKIKGLQQVVVVCLALIILLSIFLFFNMQQLRTMNAINGGEYITEGQCEQRNNPTYTRGIIIKTTYNVTNAMDEDNIALLEGLN